LPGFSVRSRVGLEPLYQRWLPLKGEWLDPNSQQFADLLGKPMDEVKAALVELRFIGGQGKRATPDAQLRRCFGDGYGLQRRAYDVRGQGMIRYQFVLLGPDDPEELAYGPISYTRKVTRTLASDRFSTTSRASTASTAPLGAAASPSSSSTPSATASSSGRRTRARVLDGVHGYGVHGDGDDVVDEEKKEEEEMMDGVETRPPTPPAAAPCGAAPDSGTRRKGPVARRLEHAREFGGMIDGSIGDPRDCMACLEKASQLAGKQLEVQELRASERARRLEILELHKRVEQAEYSAAMEHRRAREFAECLDQQMRTTATLESIIHDREFHISELKSAAVADHRKLEAQKKALQRLKTQKEKQEKYDAGPDSYVRRRGGGWRPAPRFEVIIAVLWSTLSTLLTPFGIVYWLARCISANKKNFRVLFHFQSFRAWLEHYVNERVRRATKTPLELMRSYLNRLRQQMGTNQADKYCQAMARNIDPLTGKKRRATHVEARVEADALSIELQQNMDARMIVFYVESSTRPID